MTILFPNKNIQSHDLRPKVGSELSENADNNWTFYITVHFRSHGISSPQVLKSVIVIRLLQPIHQARDDQQFYYIQIHILVQLIITNLT